LGGTIPYIDGFTLAHLIKPTPVILFTGNVERFKDILNEIDIIDAFAKPILKERLLKSAEDAYVLLNPLKSFQKFVLFHTSEGEVNVFLTDILFVKTIKSSHRSLEVYLKGGRKLILKGYSLEYIHEIAGFLLLSNRGELVSPEAVDSFDHKLIHLTGVSYKNKPAYSTLSRKHFKDFLSHFPSL